MKSKSKIELESFFFEPILIVLYERNIFVFCLFKITSLFVINTCISPMLNNYISHYLSEYLMFVLQHVL